MGAGPSGARLGDSALPTENECKAAEVVVEVVNNSGFTLFRSHVEPGQCAAELPEECCSHAIWRFSMEDEVFINYTTHAQQRDQQGSAESAQGVHLRPDQQSLPQTILSVYVGLEAGGLRSLLLGSICRIRVAATFKTHPETADELQELASTKGRISNCSWSVMVPPRTAMVTLDYAELPVLQQRRKFLDTLQARTLEDKPAIDPSIEEPGPVTAPSAPAAAAEKCCDETAGELEEKGQSAMPRVNAKSSRSADAALARSEELAVNSPVQRSERQDQESRVRATRRVLAVPPWPWRCSRHCGNRGPRKRRSGSGCKKSKR
ncbi:unnamed protein product [Effrenium voratum]|uniref:Uncharacterized protein n=1 Tax=Effrenium voratum TaxID=2562239 RepID=A0AA36HWI0_9DINO|nr:unnamed protein product [Effrenium voratum]